MDITKPFKDFASGVKIIFGKPGGDGGDRKLAKMATIVMGQIPVYGKRAVRSSLISSIEKDFKRAYKHGGKYELDKMIDNAIATPEYMTLLHKVDLDEPHVRAIAISIVNNHKKAEVK